MLGEVTPEYTQIINTMLPVKILIPITMLEAVIGQMLDSITKGKRFQDRESTLVKR